MRGSTCTRHRTCARWSPGSREAAPERRSGAEAVSHEANRMRSNGRHRRHTTAEHSCRPPRQAPCDLVTQLCEVGLRRARERTDDNVGTGPDIGQRPRADSLQPSPHGVADDGRTDLLAHDETETRSPVVSRLDHVGDGVRSGAPRTPADDGLVFRSAGQSVLPREHRVIRPRGRRGPWRDEPRGWHGRHGCACGRGSRASWHDDGCWAGKCACS